MTFRTATATLLLWSIPITAGISLADHVAAGNRNPLPASRLVDLKLHRVNNGDLHLFERAHLPTREQQHDGATFSSLLRRRDGLSIYGKEIIHGPQEPNYATLTILPMDDNSIRKCDWEATLLLAPSQTTTTTDGSCFVAMNRFMVKDDCRDLFEQRWAERSSKLTEQPGFVTFCQIRKRDDAHHNDAVPFNYSSLTIWKSFRAWTDWRNGDGRYSHDASRTLKRTPVSEWLEHSAFPIFWDGVGTIMAQSGI